MKLSGFKLVPTLTVLSLLVVAVPLYADIVTTQDTSATSLASALTAGGTAGVTVISSTLSANTGLNGTTGAAAASSGTFTLTGPIPDTYGLVRDGIVLSSGDVSDYGTGPNTSSSRTTAYGVVETAAQKALLDPIAAFTHFDVTELDIDFTSTTGSVFFDLVFGSEEYPEFVGSPFIDGFGLYLNGVNVAFSGGLPVNINHPDMAPIPGTELDGVLAPGGLPVLTFGGPTVAGTNTLTFIVADSSDAALDTTVYISGLRGTPTFVPEPASMTLLGIGAVSTFGLGWLRRKKTA